MYNVLTNDVVSCYFQPLCGGLPRYLAGTPNIPIGLVTPPGFLLNSFSKFLCERAALSALWTIGTCMSSFPLRERESVDSLGHFLIYL